MGEDIRDYLADVLSTRYMTPDYEAADAILSNDKVEVRWKKPNADKSESE